MSSTPIFPSSLPGVWSNAGSPSQQVIVTQNDQGPLAFRRISRVPGAVTQVTWTFLGDQYKTFRNFWSDTLLYGTRWFYLQLPTADGLQWCIVRANDKPYTVSMTGYRKWDVTLSLEVRERPIADDGPPAPSPGDPYFSNVVLLLHMEPNGNPTLTVDSSNLHNTMAFTSSCILSDALAKFGTSSLSNPSAPSGGVLHLNESVPDEMQLSNHQWTVECWIYFTGYSGDGGEFILNTSVSHGFSAFSFNLGYQSPHANELHAFVYNTSTQAYYQTSSAPLSLNTWHFLQARRRSDANGSDYLELGIDGAMVGLGTPIGTTGSSASALIEVTDWVVGGLASDSGDNYHGNLDEVRVTIGIAREFNLPTAPFPDH